MNVDIVTAACMAASSSKFSPLLEKFRLCEDMTDIGSFRAWFVSQMLNGDVELTTSAGRHLGSSPNPDKIQVVSP